LGFLAQKQEIIDKIIKEEENILSLNSTNNSNNNNIA
jgi:hypothetical protein